MALTISYVPGYVWTVGELVTEDKLNLAANPTINLEGTLSSASVADGAITTPKLAAGVLSADATGRSKMADLFLTLAKINTGIFTADATGRGKFADGFATATQLAEAARANVHQYAAGVYAAGVYAVTLSPAATVYTAGMVVRFKADTANTAGAVDINVNALGVKNIFQSVTLELAANAIAVNQVVELVYDGTNFQLLGVHGPDFTSAEATITQNTVVVTAAHGLGIVPTRVRWVLVCKTAELGYSVADEMDVTAASDSGTNGTHAGQGANATNVFLVVRNNANYQLFNYSTMAATNITAASWRLKCYAWK